MHHHPDVLEPDCNEADADFVRQRKKFNELFKFTVKRALAKNQVKLLERQRWMKA